MFICRFLHIFCVRVGLLTEGNRAIQSCASQMPFMRVQVCVKAMREDWP